jgi:adenylate cyclase
MTLPTYLPQDRRRALSRGTTLPDRTSGSALTADISGFTPLTETLRQRFGPRRGAEELSRHLDAVYTALIAEVERYGGSVVGFTGDAIACWFDDAEDAAVPRAVSCGLALQAAIRPFHTLSLAPVAEAMAGTDSSDDGIAISLKVAVASGPARRFAVGDPAVQRLDVLAGDTVVRLAAAEQLTQPGELLVDAATAAALQPALNVRAWRQDPTTGARFALVGELAGQSDHLVPTGPEPAIEDERLRGWLLPAVYEREQGSHSPFLTELRPAVALFLRFGGIDYESDAAAAQLDTFIRRAQQIIGDYEGILLQLTIGDKGSYLYAAFGAPVAHEDDARRAVKSALALKQAAAALDFLASMQIGLSAGVMRTGAYGGATRRTYGVLGDEVNLAARLMSQAAPGEILISPAVHRAVTADFICEPRPPIPLKGKAEPLPIFAVIARQRQRAIRLQEPAYALPMVGRQAELAHIAARMELARQGQAQIVGIVAEAGLGKSRLVGEAIRLARRKGFTGYGGACRSDGLNTPYLVWQAIWRAFFDLDPEMPLTKQARLLEMEVADRVPGRVPALPLLGAVLGIPLPENDFTRTLDPQARKNVLHALLEECLKTAVAEAPLLLVFEDVHWIDALSHDLLEEIARATSGLPIFLLLAYRPPRLTRLSQPRLETLANFSRLELAELSPAECEQAIRAKLAQLYPARGSDLPPGLAEKLTARSQGNPFYLEELLNYLRDRGVDPGDPAALAKIELPDSLHALILSRIDRLSEREKTTLRLASIIGRLFQARWLPGYYPEFGPLDQVKEALEALHALDITPLDSPEPELTYLFKHIVTHEVTYESLPFATRARLHEQLARYLETAYGDNPPLTTLAFHYGRSHNQAKQREYLLKAGEAAQKNYANEAALDFYGQLLPLLREVTEKIHIHRQRGKVLELMGRYDEAESDYRAALALAENGPTGRAEAQFALGRLSRLRGDYKTALTWLEQAKAGYAALDEPVGLAQSLVEIGAVLWNQGEYAQAGAPLREGLALMRETGDKTGATLALNNLGIVAWYLGDYAPAQTLHEESLRIRRELGDRQGIATSLNNLGLVARAQGNYAAARALFEESLILFREIGDKRNVANSLGNLGLMSKLQHDYTAAQALFAEGLAIWQEIGDKWGISLSLIYLGNVAKEQGDYSGAQALLTESLGLCREIGNKSGITVALNNLGYVAWMQGDNSMARTFLTESLALCREMNSKSETAHALLGLGLMDLAQDVPGANGRILESLRLRQELSNPLWQTSSLIGVAGLALHQGDARRGALLLGAVAAALRAHGLMVHAEMAQFREQIVAAARATLGQAAFEAAWTEGERLSLAEAVAYALAEGDA